jgi:hypothetical protein
MNRFRTQLRSFGPLAILTAVLLLVGAQWVTGVHHHGAVNGHSCPVCITAHTPAVTSITTSGVPAPRPTVVPFRESESAAPAVLAIGIAPSRAPPVA